MVTVADVKARVQEVQELPEKLLFVVGGAGSGKSKLLREVERRLYLRGSKRAFNGKTV